MSKKSTTFAADLKKEKKEAKKIKKPAAIYIGHYR